MHSPVPTYTPNGISVQPFSFPPKGHSTIVLYLPFSFFFLSPFRACYNSQYHSSRIVLDTIFKGFIYYYAERYATAAGNYKLYEVYQGDGQKTTTDHGCVCGCLEIVLAARDLSHPSL